MKQLENFAEPQKPWEVEGVEWREVRLGDIVILVRNGLTYKQFYRFPKENSVPVARIETIANEYIDKNYFGFLDANSLSKEIINNWQLMKGDILFSHINSPPHLGKTAIYCGDPPLLLHGMNLLLIRPNKEIISPEYLNYFLKFLRNEGIFQFFAKKAINQASINQKAIKNLKTPLPFRNGKPDLETQKKIVEYIEANFTKIDRILERKKEELEQLDELWESVLKQAFKPKDGEEWREVKLGNKNYFRIETGATPKTSVKEYWENGTIKWATPKDLGKNNGKHLIDTDRKITETGLNSCSTTLIPKGSILISTRAPIGHIAILGDEMCFNQGCKGVVTKTGQILNEFIYYVLLTKVELMKILGTGPTFEELSKDKLGTIKIPLPFRNNQPDLEKQKEIANYLDSIYEKIKTLKEKIQNQINQLEDMKESILDEVFNHEN